MKLERTSFDQSKLEGPNPIIKTFNLRSYAQARSASLRTNRVVAAEEWTGSRPPTDLVQRPGRVREEGGPVWSWSLIWRWSVRCWSVCCAALVTEASIDEFKW